MKRNIILLIICAVVFFGCVGKTENMPKGNFEKDLLSYANSIPEFQEKSKDANSLDPAILFGYSYYLFKKDRKDEAIFVYYLAQLRARILLNILAQPTSLDMNFYERAKKESGLISLGQNIYFSAPNREQLYWNIMQGLGAVINGYAGSRPDVLIDQMNKVLKYEKQSPFNFADIAGKNIVSKYKIKEGIAKETAGLMELIKYTKQRKGFIAKQNLLTQISSAGVQFVIIMSGDKGKTVPQNLKERIENWFTSSEKGQTCSDYLGDKEQFLNMVLYKSEERDTLLCVRNNPLFLAVFPKNVFEGQSQDSKFVLFYNGKAPICAAYTEKAREICKTIISDVYSTGVEEIPCKIAPFCYKINFKP